MHDVFAENPMYARDFVLCAVAAIAALVAAAILPRQIVRWFRLVDRTLARLGARPATAFGAVAATSLVISILATALCGVPIPRVQDEFSYLLAGDTFAHGRLTNPQHPMWKHFETIHVLHEPTYQSKYGVAQGMTLALGQVLTGLPCVGVWLSTAAACVAALWALFGWTRSKWAVLGGFILAMHPMVISWSQMYWGGTVGMTGGALIMGAVPRVIRSMRARDAALGAAGLAILMNCRPYEAAVWFVLAGGSVLVGWALRQPRPRFGWTVVLALVALVVLLPVGGFMLYYNNAVTHDPFTLPYALHVRQYMATPLFYWSAPPPPKTYRYRALYDQYQVWERRWLEAEQTPGGFIAWTTVKVNHFCREYIARSIPMALGLVVLPWAVRRDPRTRLAIAYFVTFCAAWLIIPWFIQHYASPALCALVVLALRGLRDLNVWRPRWRDRLPVGRALMWLVAASCVAVLVPTLMKIHRENTRPSWWHDRARIIAELQRVGGKHLILVRYSEEHRVSAEWVFNGADLDGAPVVLARSWTRDEDAKLIHYYRDRTVWVIDADGDFPQLSPYRGAD